MKKLRKIQVFICLLTTASLFCLSSSVAEVAVIPGYRTYNVALISAHLPSDLLVPPFKFGYNSANAFDMGWCLGIASYQASMFKYHLAESAVSNAQTAANKLTNSGVNRLTNSGLLHKINIWSDVSPPGDLHDNLVKMRNQYESRIRQKSNNAANAYRLGLLIGLAEGQCSSKNNWGSSQKYAHDALKQVNALIRTGSLANLKFNYTLVNIAIHRTSTSEKTWESAYAEVVEMRKAYRQTILVSNY